MAVKRIEKNEWYTYFQSFSKMYLKDRQPEYADILILTNDGGAQPETSWLPLEGITYDTKSDVLDIKVEDLNRMILYPTEIYVDEDQNGWINSIEIVQTDGTKNIIEIR